MVYVAVNCIEIGTDKILKGYIKEDFQKVVIPLFQLNKVKMKRLTKWILWILGIAVCVILLNSVFSSKESLTVIQIKESDKLHFTNQYDKDALLMIPAAYTNEDGTIQGGIQNRRQDLWNTLTQGKNIASSDKRDCHIRQLAL